MGNGAAWLGMARPDADDGAGADGRWRLHVDDGVTSGAHALFGGGATAAALVAARVAAPQPLVWAAAHFGALAKAGTDVDLTTRTISAGRTMTHLEVTATVGEREAFVVRLAAGERPAHPVQGQWVAPPSVPTPDDCDVFDHPVHHGTWAARFDWRLAGSAAPGGGGDGPWAAWWVRARPDDPCEALVRAAVLLDYVTYGVGRALGEPLGGLSVDNVVRIHDLDAATDHGTDDGWLLLDIRPEGIHGGFGQGAARLFTPDGRLVATGTQSMVVNTWDWR